MSAGSSLDPVSASQGTAEIYLQCSKCHTRLADASLLCFFDQSRSQHLTIRYEMQVDYANGTGTPPVIFKPQTDAKKLRISSHEFYCQSCDNGIGSLNAIGPARENILCFRSKTTCLIKNSNTMRGDWNTVARFLPEVEKRDISNFYGSVSDAGRADIVNIPIRYPSIYDVVGGRLRELSLDKPRPYQIESFAACSQKNTILYLPTGAGKTLVAVMMISLLHKLNPAKTIFFVVDRVPLVFQQGQYITDQTHLNILIACGENSEEVPVRKLREYAVIASTAQVLINFIRRGWVRMEDASLIVFDEIHHAVKAHPFALLIENYYQACASEVKPLLLGLTASPVGGRPVDMSYGLSELCQKANANVFMPCFYWQDLLGSVYRPQIAFIVVETTEDGCSMEAAIEAYCTAVMRVVRDRLGIKSVIELPEVYDLNRARALLRTLSAQAHAEKNEAAVDLLHHIQQIVSAHELNSIVGPRYARSYIQDVFSYHKKEDNSNVVQTFLANISALDSLSAKLAQLFRILHEIEPCEDTRAIVFVQRKRTARHLCRVLEAELVLEEKWKPAVFVGQNAGQLDGMSWADHQSPALQKFRAGAHRLLISTSVLQEGIDVPMCDHIILFDQSWTLTSFIQSRGRARAKDSHYILICNQEQKLAYENLMRGEEIMHSLILRHMYDCQSYSPTMALAAIYLARQAAQAVNWTNQDHVTRLGGASATSTDVKKTFKAIHLVFHNLPPGSPHLQLETFDFLRELGLKNMSGHGENDAIFPDKMAFAVQAEPSMGSALRIFEVAKLLQKVSPLLNPLDSMVSFRVGIQNLNRSSEQFMFMGENLDLGALVDFKTFNCLSSLKMPLKIGLNMRLGAIQIFLVTLDQRVFRIDLDFGNIERLILIDLDQEDQSTSIYVPLRGAANYYFTHANPTVDIKLTTVDLFTWERASLREIKEFIDISDISVFKIDVFLSNNLRDYLFSVLRRFDAYGLTVLFGKVVCHPNLPHMFDQHNCGQIAHMSQEFKSVYDVLVLSSSCYPSLMYRTVAPRFMEILASVPEHDRHRVLLELCLELLARPFADVISTLNSIVADELHGHPTPEAVPLPFDSSVAGYDESSNTTLVRYVVLTPTRVVFQAPKSMTRNRILRAFNPEYFLRVLFRDEDLQRLSSVKSGAGMKCIYNRIADFLTAGIIIGDRKYDFLAMSSSQLRDHGCWFVCPHYMDVAMEKGSPSQQLFVDANYVRDWCGDFSSIKNVAKYVARLGQSLSASLNVSQVSNQEYDMIPDHEVMVTAVDGKQQKYIFTDGIGVISYSVAQEIAKTMALNHVPTAYQIRFAGFKGVLATDPHSNQKDDTRKIQFRPSMMKFSSIHQTLEVLNWSAYIPCYLNRQVLLILSSLGVPNESFTLLQDKMLKQMPEMLLDRKGASCALSQGFKILPRLPFIDISNWSFDNEPFFRSLLLAIYRRQLVELLTRSRVFVPMGRILMGTIDETGTLEEDEIFVQLSRQLPDDEAIQLGLLQSTNDDRFVVVAEVAVAKNPCMHPGDVRRLKAVRSELLERYHYDCVVFPRKGLRPITDMCSGSDLDGDLYFVTWDPSLLPPTLHPPMDYSAPAAKEVEKISLADVQEFLINFIANDQLGTIANSHMAHADLLPEGVCAPLCMHLAYIFSLAVDFPKTGIIPTFPKEGKVSSWPDFMQKYSQTTHMSSKVMGTMFRKARSIFYSGVSYMVEESRLDESLLVEGHEAYLDSAALRYNAYSESLASTLKLYGLTSEAPVFTGSLIEMKAGVGKEDMKDIIEIVERKVKEIVAHYRKLFMEEVGYSDTEARRLASAWYRVTYGAPWKPRGLSSAILSFPWVVGDVLLRCRQTPVTIYNDTRLQLGTQIVASAQKIIQEEIIPSSIERLDFFVLLQSLIRSAVEATTRIELSGTSLGHLHAMNSDLNIFVNVSDESMKGPIMTALSSSFVVNFRNGVIEHRGMPFNFTLFRNTDWHEAAITLRHLTMGCAESLALSLVLLRWARGQSLVRSTSRHSGRLTATALVLICSHLGVRDPAEKNITSSSINNNSVSTMDSEMHNLIDIQTVLSNLDSARLHEMGDQFLSVMQCFAFQEDTIKTLIGNDPLIRTSPDCTLYLRELAFQAYQLLAQTLQVSNLWKMSHSPEMEREIAVSRRRPKLMRTYGKSNSVFMEGSSTLLYEGSTCAKDLVHFDLFQMQRRPKHKTAQCYLPVLVDPSMYNPLDGSQYVYQQYFAHAFRQFDLARRTGSAEFGIMRASVKFGCLYVTNLPRLFVEEGLSATVGRSQEALGLGYRTVGDVSNENYFRRKSAGFALNFIKEDAATPIALLAPPMANTEQVKLEEIVDARLGKEEDRLKTHTSLIKKKAVLGSLTSSFEPLVRNDEAVRQFLAENNFTCTKEFAGYAVSLALFNSSTRGNCDFQVVYDPTMTFQRMRYRPLRWMQADVRGVEADGRDYRFLLSSIKSIELDECLVSDDAEAKEETITDLRPLIKSGIVRVESDASDPTSTLRVVPEFRKNESLLVRSSHTERFHLPTAGLAESFLDRHPTLRTIPVAVLLRLQVMLVQVTEYSGHDQTSGLFQEISDKTEMDLSFSLDWEELAVDGKLAAELIPAMWKFAHIFRSLLA